MGSCSHQTSLTNITIDINPPVKLENITCPFTSPRMMLIFSAIQYYGCNSLSATLHILYAPMIIPSIPTPIAKIKKFFFSMYTPHCGTFSIDSVPSIASSNLTVSVACSGKKFNTFAFGILLRFLPKISCIPFSVEPYTTRRLPSML